LVPPFPHFYPENKSTSIDSYHMIHISPPLPFLSFPFLSNPKRSPRLRGISRQSVNLPALK
jgi:hypothetical protein